MYIIEGDFFFHTNHSNILFDTLISYKEKKITSIVCDVRLIDFKASVLFL